MGFTCCNSSFHILHERISPGKISNGHPIPSGKRLHNEPERSTLWLKMGQSTTSIGFYKPFSIARRYILSLSSRRIPVNQHRNRRPLRCIRVFVRRREMAKLCKSEIIKDVAWPVPFWVTFSQQRASLSCLLYTL